MKRKALFIGGTGTISMAVTKLLAQDPEWELWLLNRGNRQSDLPERANVIHVDGNDEEQVIRALEGMRFDSVCDFIGFVPEQLQRDYRIFAGRTKNIK